MSKYSDLKRTVTTACAILGNEGLADFVGHVSGRLPNARTFLISPRLATLKDIKKRELATVNLDTSKTQSEFQAPHEVYIHSEIYKKRNDVNGVVHTHAKFTTAFAISGEPILPVHHIGLAFNKGVPIFPHYKMVSDQRLGKMLAEQLGSSPAILLQNHGAVTVGRTVEEACILSIWLEQIAEWQILSKIIGVPKAIPQEQDAEQFRQHTLDTTVLTAWKYYKSKLRQRS
jgi:ribulose-5-phosphate 4-epimerase/fuculose-1-phosphate aldolase